MRTRDEGNFNRPNDGLDTENSLFNALEQKYNSFDSLKERVELLLEFWIVNRGVYDHYTEHFVQKLKDNAKDSGDFSVLGWCYFIQAWLKMDFGKSNEGLLNFNKAWEEFSKCQEYEGLIQTLLGEEQAYSEDGGFAQGLEKYLHALKMAKEEGNALLAFSSCLSAAVLLIEVRQYHEAMDYLEKGLVLEGISKAGLGVLNYYLAKVYRLLGRFKQAEEHNQEALTIGEEENLSILLKFCQLTSACLKEKKGEHEGAKELFLGLLLDTRNISSLKAKGLALLELGKLENFLGQKEKARGYLRDALEIFNNLGAKKDEKATWFEIFKVCGESGDFQKAYQASNEYQKLHSLTFDKEIRNRMDVMKMQQAYKENLIYEDLYNRINAISEVGQAITSTFHIEKIGETIYTHLKKIMDIAGLNVCLYSEDKKNILAKISIMNGEALPEYSIPLAEGRIVVSKEGELVNDTSISEEIFLELENNPASIYSKDFKSYLCSPLVVRGNILGYMKVQSKRTNAYLPHHLYMLNALAVYVAIAVENQRLFSNVNKLATIDSLTGLLNRREIFVQAEEEFRRFKRYNDTFSVVMIDIDKFKEINDLYGHFVGDLVLEKVAEAFRDEIRSTDILGRMGGDEFLLIMPNTPIEGAIVLAARLQEAVFKRDYFIGDNKINIKTSMGITQTNFDDQELGEVITRADQALYDVKRVGGDRFKEVDVYS